MAPGKHVPLHFFSETSKLFLKVSSVEQGSALVCVELILGVIKAKQLFEEVIAIDPDFALAHGHLSLTSMIMGRYYSSGESRRKNFEKGLELAEKANSLDSSKAEPHMALGYYYTTQHNFNTVI